MSSHISDRPTSKTEDDRTRLWSRGSGLVATRTLQALAIIAGIAVIIVGLTQLSIVVLPVLIAIIIASAVYPLVNLLQRHGVPALLSTWITLFAIVAVLGGIVWLVVWQVVNQWSDLTAATQAGIKSLQQFTKSLPFSISEDQLPKLWAWFTSFVTSSSFGKGAIAGVSAAATFFTAFGVFVVVLFFLLKDGPQIWEFLLRPFHGTTYERAWRVGRQATTTFGGYVRGTSIVAAADAIGIGIGLLILQIPLAIPLIVIVFVTAFIPIVGATLAGIVAALVAIVTNGPLAAVIVIAIVVVVNQVEGNLLQPIVMGRTLKLHPLVILIALTIGTTLGGILGAILAVPLTAAAWAVLQVWEGPHTPATFVRQKTSVEAIRPESGS